MVIIRPTQFSFTYYILQNEYTYSKLHNINNNMAQKKYLSRVKLDFTKCIGLSRYAVFRIHTTHRDEKRSLIQVSITSIFYLPPRVIGRFFLR